jgi:DNA sulfur modification protein DndD
MLLKKVVLENYGPYSGKHEFDLVPRKKEGVIQPIILFGGNNGAGKTTLLDAVRLAFYGKKSLGTSVSEKAYKELLRRRIHFSQNDVVNPNFAKLCVEFDFVLNGIQSVYHIERAWSKKNTNDIEEVFRIECDGSPLTDIDSSSWETFISDIVPERLSRLFFFDGEKIKKMAEDVSGASAKEAIQNLLGLDLVERLKADLSLYKRKELKQLGSEQDAKELEEATRGVIELKKEEDSIELKLCDTNGELNTLKDKIRQSEARFHEQGGAYAEDRSRQQTLIIEAEIEIELLKKTIQKEVAGVFPLSLCPRITKALVVQLDKESELKQANAIRRVLKELSNSFKQTLEKSDEIDSNSSNTSLSIFAGLVEKVQDNQDSISVIHDISDSKSAHYQNLFLSSEAKSQPYIHELALNLEKTSKQLLSAKKNESRAPEQEAIKPFIQELQILLIEQGKLDSKVVTLEERLTGVRNRLSRAERMLEKVEDKIQSNSKATRRLSMVSKTQDALSEYQQRLTEAKLSVLEGSVTECFNRLFRKEDTIQKISIDPVSFKVTLKDRRGNLIPKSQLSAGEKQIYSISFLWGLAKTSGRPLPVIIDTPLGRLDSTHRNNLIERYFPYAGHQVILLSTDTEIDNNHFEMLAPHISHCYHLKYDSKSGSTTPHEEYFWKDPAYA